MAFDVSVVICTCNPRPDYFLATLESLRRQVATFSWELIVIDNASKWSLKETTDLAWHPHARVVREDKLGLAYARFRGFREAQSPIVIFVDDDNVLDPDYVALVAQTMAADASLGAIGGKSIPRYEVEPPPWFAELGISLACRDLGESLITTDWKDLPVEERSYPECAPVGAGMGIRREALAIYVAAAEASLIRSKLGRRGADLASGEDNDMMMSLLDDGWRLAYIPALRLEHLIPARRVSLEYLASYACSCNRTWVKALDVHHIRPWSPIARWTLPLRNAKAFVVMRAWRGAPHFIRWRASCGTNEGRAELNSIASSQ